MDQPNVRPAANDRSDYAWTAFVSEVAWRAAETRLENTSKPFDKSERCGLPALGLTQEKEREEFSKANAANGITVDESGNPQRIQCKNASGNTEVFRRTGQDASGGELWSINGGTAYAMDVKVDAKGNVVLSYASGGWNVKHEIKNGVRGTEAKHK